jgi:hypothetical protein
MALLWVAQG